MTETDNPPTHEPVVVAEGAPSARGARGLGWRRLQTVAAGVTVVSFVIPMAIEGKVEGFLVAMAAPFVVGLVLVFFLPRVAAVFLGVVAVATFAASGPYIGQALTHPESATDFVPQTLFTLSLAIAAIAAVPAYREISRRQAVSRTPRALAIAATVVALVASALSLMAAAGVDDVAVQPGDHTLLTRDFAFSPGEFTTDAGVISVYLANEDSTRHTFTIDGLTDLSVPPKSTQRATFEAAPGTYPYYCRPHPDMQGVLVVQ
jgi:plastocyanin